MKEKIIQDFCEVLNTFFNETGSLEITRDYFIKKSKFKRKYEKYFTFSELKQKYSKIKDIPLTNKKRFIISSIVANSKNDNNFLNALLRYCLENNAQLLLVPIKGVNKEFNFDKEVIEAWGKYFVKNIDFNSNLRLINAGITANNRNPLYRLKELGHKGYSVIVGACKQRMEIIPSLKTGKTHLIYSTGTVSYPNYKDNITGYLNEENNKLGALVVEVIDDTFFNIRNVQWVNNSFVDLNKRYYFEKVEPVSAAAIVAGDLHISGDEDPEALKILKEQIKFLKTKKLFIHDLASHNSINHHESENSILSARNILTLEEEHKYISNWLKKWTKDIKEVELICVASNHNDWLYQYLANRKTWLYDKINTKYASSLYSIALEGKDPFEYAIKKMIEPDLKIKFLKRSDSYKIGGYELSMHGDKCNGMNKASLKQLEESVGRLICGHSHTPKILDNSYQVGTNTKIPLPYTKGTANNWVHCNASIYDSGHVQLIMSFNGKWKIN